MGLGLLVCTKFSPFSPAPDKEEGCRRVELGTGGVCLTLVEFFGCPNSTRALVATGGDSGLVVTHRCFWILSYRCRLIIVLH